MSVAKSGGWSQYAAEHDLPLAATDDGPDDFGGPQGETIAALLRALANLRAAEEAVKQNNGLTAAMQLHYLQAELLLIGDHVREDWGT